MKDEYIVDVNSAFIAAGVANFKDLFSRIDPCYSCPIALAIKDATGQRFRVGPVKASNYEHNKVCFLPKEAQDFILNFDSQKPVEPFTFVLKLENNFL